MLESFGPESTQHLNSFANPYQTGLVENLEPTGGIIPPVPIKFLVTGYTSHQLINADVLLPQIEDSLIGGDNSFGLIEDTSVDSLTGIALSEGTDSEHELFPILQQAVRSAHDSLTGLTTDPDYNTKMNLAFGDNFNTKVANDLVQKFAVGDFRETPAIEVLSSAAINGANGAFAKATNTIYLSKEFVEQNAGNPEAITSVLLEETGHFIDSKINVSDAAGDEGDIFARLKQGKTISAGELLDLKAEDDTATVILDGKTTQIEQSEPFRGTVDAQINVRSGPGTNFNVVSALNPGNSRTFDSVTSGTTHWDDREQRNDNNWFRIQGTNNWVAAAYITGNPAFNGTVDAAVNVRSGPGTNFATVEGLSTGASRTFDGVNVGTTHWDQREGRNENRWFRLQGTDRWVSAAFITGEPNNQTSTATPTPQTSTFTNFIGPYIGTKYDIDSFPKGIIYQCTDWAARFVESFAGLGKPNIMLASGGAKDWFEDFGRSGAKMEWNPQKITNQPNNYPDAGDIVVWKGTTGNIYGHVAVADFGSTVNELKVIEQNGGNGLGQGTGTDAIRRQTGNYNNVLGWIRIPTIHKKIYGY